MLEQQWLEPRANPRLFSSLRYDVAGHRAVSQSNPGSPLGAGAPDPTTLLSLLGLLLSCAPLSLLSSLADLRLAVFTGGVGYYCHRLWSQETEPALS